MNKKEKKKYSLAGILAVVFVLMLVSTVTLFGSGCHVDVQAYTTDDGIYISEYTTCPTCGDDGAYLYYVDGYVAHYICYGMEYEAHSFTINYDPNGAVEEEATPTPEPIYYTVTYNEYLTSDKPTCSTRTVSVREFNRHTIQGSTVNEYVDRDGARYEFTGKWLVNGVETDNYTSLQVTSDLTITPVYQAYYVITYYDANGKSVFQSFEVSAGEFHKIIKEYPEKVDDKYTYEFLGWTFNDVVQTGYQVVNSSKYFYPSYSKDLKTNLITYLDADGGVYDEVKVGAGKTFELPSVGPEKEATDGIGYTFAGWLLNGEPVSGTKLTAGESMTLTPSYTEYEITPEATAEPVNEQNEAPAAEEPDQTTEEPTPVVTPEPTTEPTTEPTAEPTAEPTVEPVSETIGEIESNEEAATEASAVVTEEITEEEELEEIDLDDKNETPMGAIVAAGAGTVGLIAAAAVVIAKTAGGAAAAGAAGTAGKAAAGTVKAAKAAKTAKTAAKAADAAAKAKAIRDIELEAKTVLLAVTDSDLRKELTALFGKKKFIALKTTRSQVPSEIAGTAGKTEAVLVVIDTLKNESNEAFMERVKSLSPFGSNYKVVAVSNDSYTSVSEDTFKALKKSGAILDYTSAGVSESQKMVKLVLPAYKPEINVENSAEFIGHVTDALGIPVVSTVIELFVNGKEIKDTLASKSVDVSDISTVVGNIASIFGIDAVESVSKLINGIDTARDVIKTEDVSEV